MFNERAHSPEADLGVLRNLLTELQSEKTPAEKIEILHPLLFERTGNNPRIFTLAPASIWKSPDIERGLGLIEEIAVSYTFFFHDPRIIPVTHYARQKRIAMHLDEEFSKLLRRAVQIFSRDPFLKEDGSPVPDAFLDKPILDLKQEARDRRLTLSKKNSGLNILHERFQMRLTGKGLKPGERGFHEPEGSRQDAARKKLANLLSRARPLSG